MVCSSLHDQVVLGVSLGISEHSLRLFLHFSKQETLRETKGAFEIRFQIRFKMVVNKFPSWHVIHMIEL